MTSGHTFRRKCSCAAMASVDSPRAMKRAIPAKRPREGGVNLAPASAHAAVPPTNYQEERRVRQRVASSVTPDQDAAAPAAAAQSRRAAGATAQSGMAAAGGPERTPLEAGWEQPAAAKSGQRRSRAASQIKAPGRQPVTRSMAASRQLPNVLPTIPESSLATGRVPYS